MPSVVVDQKEAAEVHFLPAAALKERDAAGFADWMLTYGVELRT